MRLLQFLQGKNVEIIMGCIKTSIKKVKYKVVQNIL